MPSIGVELQSRREQKGLSLQEIAQKTKISRRYLEYMENDNFEKLPGGVFNRAFLRAYARELGLDADALLEQYRRENPQPETHRPESWPRFYRYRPFGKFLLTWGGSLTLFVLGSLYVYREIVANRSQLEEARNAADSQIALSQLPPSTATATMEVPEVPVPREVAEQPQARRKPRYPLNLVIKAINQCWISVMADGRQITSQLLARGDELPFRARNQLSLILGNAGGVVLTVNGIKLRRPGTTGEVKRLVLSLDNYKEYGVDTTSPSP